MAVGLWSGDVKDGNGYILLEKCLFRPEEDNNISSFLRRILGFCRAGMGMGHNLSLGRVGLAIIFGHI